MKNAHIISIGNELLIGDTINTNASWIGTFLTEMGFYVEQVFTIPDSYELIQNRIDESLQTADITIVTGGLGPTHDDITKKAVADLFGVEMTQDESVFMHVKSLFEKRNFTFSKSNADQALIPVGARVLFNNKGTAPGMWISREKSHLAILPGVPYEMKFLMENRVKPEIEEHFPGLDSWATQYFKTAGVPESTLSDLIGNLEKFEKNGVAVAYLPSAAGVTIRISSSGREKRTAEDKLIQLREMLYEKVGDLIYGEGKNLTLPEVVGELLAERKLTISAAESCTGGHLANSLTDIPGSSRYLHGGVVAYADQIKVNHLGVLENELQGYGAVSKSVALQMAKAVAVNFKTDIGVSTTGIAGPSGGTEEKPVGTVWMGFSINDNHFALKAVFTNDRLINKERTVMVVLETIRRQLKGIDGFPYQLKPQYS
jgi:nicotinamide-nucleotide amidase